MTADSTIAGTRPIDAFRQWLDRLAKRLGGLSGWRRHTFAAGLGVLATLALPPVYFMPVLYPAFAGLVWMLPFGIGRRPAFFTGWWFGIGFFASSIYWIGFAPITFSADLWWVMPFAMLGLPVLLSVFHGTATLAASRFQGGYARRALLLAIAWSIAEWLRGQVLTGLPWNLVGYGWTGSDAMAQSAAWFGMYGVTVLAVTSAALPAAVAGGSSRRRLLALAVAAALPLGAWAGGALRLAAAPPVGTDYVPGVGLRLVQANIPQREKWSRDLIRRNFSLHLNLSVRNRPGWITDVIWPETAVVVDLTRHADWAASAGAAAPPGGLLLTGTPRRADNPPRVWNSMVAIDEDGRVVASFDKFHLVPFGEYMPMKSILPLEKITPGSLDFSSGPGPRAVVLPGLPAVGPLICYEAIFPGEVVNREHRPGWLLNLTNDAWYGQTAGPHQHLAITRMRAIEEGMPLVRSANTGISAVFDAYGREVGRVGLNRQGVLDVRLPQAAEEPPLYATVNDLSFLFLVVILMLALLRVPNN